MSTINDIISMRNRCEAALLMINCMQENNISDNKIIDNLSKTNSRNLSNSELTIINQYSQKQFSSNNLQEASEIVCLAHGIINQLQIVKQGGIKVSSGSQLVKDMREFNERANAFSGPQALKNAISTILSG